MKSATTSIRLGFEVGRGTPVEIPIRHMCVTGQTQEAGKTTTLEVSIARRVVTAEGGSTIGRVARLIRADFLADSKRFSEILRELERTGTRVNNKSLSVALKELVAAGFLTKESVDRYRAVADMKVRVVEAA